jgi:opacity protein-like surface antigen
VDLFGGYQLTNVDFKSGLTGIDRQSYHGWDVDLAAHVTKNLSLTADFGSAYKTITVNGVDFKSRMYPILFGPRVGVNLGKVTPFVEGLFGFAHMTGNVAGITASENKFAMAVGGGLDFHLSNNIALRLPKFDYLMVTSGDPTLGHLNNLRVATGIVFKF